MKDTRIDDLVKTILTATTVREVLDADGNRMSVGSNRLHLEVTPDVAIIIETDMSPLYDVWIQNHTEGEGCTVAKTADLRKVAEFIISVFNLCGVKPNGPKKEG